MRLSARSGRRRVQAARGRRTVLAGAAVAIVGGLAAAVVPFAVPAAGASSVAGASVAADNYLAGDTAAQWTFTFTTSASGSLNFSSNDSVTVGFPPGFDVSGAFIVGYGGFTGCFGGVSTSATVSGQLVTVPLSAGCALAASSQGSVTVSGIQPAAGSYPVGTFSVSTSQDTTSVAATSVTGSGATSITITPPTSVSAVTFSGSPATAGAASATWTAAFQPSASGGLSGAVPDTVDVVFPSGFTLPGSPTVTFATGFSGSCPSVPALASGQDVTITLPSGCSLAASTPASVTIAGVTNPGAGSYTGSVLTSKDTASATSAPFSIVAAAPTSVSAVTFSGSPATAGAASATWTAAFQPSASGSLSAGDTVDVVFPSGFTLPGSPTATFATGFSGSCPSTTGSTSGQDVTITLPSGCSLAASTPASVTIAGLTNPGAGSYTGSVLTSKDTASATSAPFSIVAPAPPPIATSTSFSMSPTGQFFSLAAVQSGQPETLTASVSPPVVGGAVTFRSQTLSINPSSGALAPVQGAPWQALPGCSDIPVDPSGVATCTTSFSAPPLTSLSTGDEGYALRATFTGEGRYLGSTSTPYQFAVINVPVPAVAKVTPNKGTSPGAGDVTITGTWLDNPLGPPAVVRFGSQEATVVNSYVNEVVVSPPVGPPGTTVDVTVSTISGTSKVVPADRYTFLARAPYIKTISPTTGPPSGGTDVTITGFDLDPQQFNPKLGQPVVRFGKQPGSVLHATNSSIVVASPGGSEGSSVAVTISTTGGTSSYNAGLTNDRFVYASRPIVTALSPSAAPTDGGTRVTITGANFDPSLGTPVVRFGRTKAKVVAKTASSLTVVAPRHAQGPTELTVTTKGGTSATQAASRFSYFVPLYARPSANGSCTKPRPCTLTTALSRARDQGMVYLDGGVYRPGRGSSFVVDHSITLKPTTSGSSVTLKGHGATVVIVRGHASATIAGVTITGGYGGSVGADFNTGMGSVGGIEIRSGASLVLRSSTVTHNRGGNGTGAGRQYGGAGGIADAGASLVLESSTVSYNTGGDSLSKVQNSRLEDRAGTGGIFAAASANEVKLVDSVVEHNIGGNGGPQAGAGSGGIELSLGYPLLDLVRSKVAYNRAGSGGFAGTGGIKGYYLSTGSIVANN